MARSDYREALASIVAAVLADALYEFVIGLYLAELCGAARFARIISIAGYGPAIVTTIQR